MRILLIGYGSIAKKHLQALNELVQNTTVFALRSQEVFSSEEMGIVNIFSLDVAIEIDFIIICNPTFLHANTLEKVIKYKKPIFLEKPPFAELSQIEINAIETLKLAEIPVYCAFNMRYLESLRYLKQNITLSDVQEVNIYCGSYLPDWRVGVDYKKNYSAISAQGGGVHLDLIHEIDYALWIFGLPKEVRALKKSNSHLEIDAIDYANFILIYDSFIVNITLNYYRRDAKRDVEIILKDKTVSANLLKNEITNSSNGEMIYQSGNKVSDTYKVQMKYFLNCVENGFGTDDSFEESIAALKIALI